MLSLHGLGVAALGLLVGCGEPPEPRRTFEWTPDRRAVVWHHEAERIPQRANWGPLGRDPSLAFVDGGLSPFEILFEFHSGSPTQTGADPETWEFPLYFGIGEPFTDPSGAVHMYECSREGAVYEREGHLAFCPPGTGILFIAYVAEAPVAVEGRPELPAPVREWWAENLAFELGTEADRWENLTLVTKYAYYGRSGRGYEVPVTFHPRAVHPGPPYEDLEIERWRKALFDDRP